MTLNNSVIDWIEVEFGLTWNIFPVLKKLEFFSLLSVNRRVRQTRPRFSSTTKPSPSPELPLRSRRTSSIRVCFQPLNGAACGALSVFMCAVCVCVSAPPPPPPLILSHHRGFMEMSYANAPRAFWGARRASPSYIFMENNVDFGRKLSTFYSKNRCFQLKQSIIWIYKCRASPIFIWKWSSLNHFSFYTWSN